MNETFLPKVAAAFSILAVLTNFSAMGIGIRAGGMPPHLIDFGSGEHLSRLLTNHESLVAAFALGLISPCFGVVAGLGWYDVLKTARPFALFGAAMFFVGMIFVVLLDVLELSLFVSLPPAYAAAPENSKAGVLAVGAALGLTRDVLGYAGHFFGSALADVGFALAIFKSRAVPHWLGWLLIVPTAAIGWLATPLALAGQPSLAAPLLMIGFPCFFFWMLCMAFILWRWQPPTGTERNAD